MQIRTNLQLQKLEAEHNKTRLQTNKNFHEMWNFSVALVLGITRHLLFMTLLSNREPYPFFNLLCYDSLLASPLCHARPSSLGSFLQQLFVVSVS